jgi:hypothetical protein
MATLLAGQTTGSPLRVLEVDTPRATAQAGGVPKRKAAPVARKKSHVTKGKPVNIAGQEYRSLDEYLARLERDGFIGKAWYREVRPGMYELVTNLRPPPEKRLFTRAELEREFGFAK